MILLKDKQCVCYTSYKEYIFNEMIDFSCDQFDFIILLLVLQVHDFLLHLLQMS